MVEWRRRGGDPSSEAVGRVEDNAIEVQSLLNSFELFVHRWHRSFELHSSSSSSRVLLVGLSGRDGHHSREREKEVDLVQSS